MGKAARLKIAKSAHDVSRASIETTLKDLRQQHAQALGNVNALAGAMAICEQLLAAKPTAPPPIDPDADKPA